MNLIPKSEFWIWILNLNTDSDSKLKFWILDTKFDSEFWILKFAFCIWILIRIPESESEFWAQDYESEFWILIVKSGLRNLKTKF